MKQRRRRICNEAGIAGRAALRPHFSKNWYRHLVTRQVAPRSQFEVKQYKNQRMN